MLEIAMKDNEKRELVSRITAVALEYRDAEQLRERIRDAVLPAIDAAEAAERERWAHVFDGWRVLQELTPEQRKRIGHADVSDVLDAVARLYRA